MHGWDGDQEKGFILNIGECFWMSQACTRVTGFTWTETGPDCWHVTLKERHGSFYIDSTKKAYRTWVAFSLGLCISVGQGWRCSRAARQNLRVDVWWDMTVSPKQWEAAWIKPQTSSTSWGPSIKGVCFLNANTQSFWTEMECLMASENINIVSIIFIYFI